MTETQTPEGDPEGSLEAISQTVLRLLDAARDTPSRLRVESGGTAVEMEWPSAAIPAPVTAPAAAPAPVPIAADGSGANGKAAGPAITAPTIGTFFHAPEPGAAPFVLVGDEVAAGQQVGIIEVMKLMTPVEADRPGRVVEMLVPDGKPVEHGQPLIALAS